MLVRSASTPVLGALHASSCAGGHYPAVHFADSSPTVEYHPPAISCSLPGAGSDHERSRGSGAGGLRRACSDGNLSSLCGGRADEHHRSRPAGAALETIQSFTARDGCRDEEDDDDDEDAEQEMSFGMFAGDGGIGSTYTAQEHPLFLARGLGIDRLGSGLLSGIDDGGMDGGGTGGGYLVDSCGGGDRSGIEAHYKKLIEEDPCNGLFLRNYAQFLFQVKGDRRRAEEYYSRAILADPNDGELLSEYAKLVWEVHHDEDRASSYFDRATRASPHTCAAVPPSGRSRTALETIQSFTARDGGKDEEEDYDDDDEDAEQEMSFGMFGAGIGSTYTAQEHPLFLARGLGIDRLGSGLFSADGGGIDNGGSGGAGGGYLVASYGGGDRSGIEAHYKRLIEEDPCNGLFLRNYAQFLYQVKGDRRRAEEYYSRAILADPNDGELLSEYAKLVWEVHRDEDRGSSYFDRAARASPHDSHVLAAQAAFLWDTEDDDSAGPEEAMSYTGFGVGAHPSMASATT